MPESTPIKRTTDEVQRLIREGLIEGIRQEVERRRRLGIPLYIDRDGKVVAVLADGTLVTDHPGIPSNESKGGDS